MAYITKAKSIKQIQEALATGECLIEQALAEFKERHAREGKGDGWRAKYAKAIAALNAGDANLVQAAFTKPDAPAKAKPKAPAKAKAAAKANPWGLDLSAHEQEAVMAFLSLIRTRA